MNLFIVVTLCFISCVESVENNQALRPNLPVGPIKIDVKRYMPCDLEKKHKIQMNFYLHKTSKTTTVTKGNMSLNGIQFDDNINIKINFDIQDPTGGWSDNSVVFKKEKACSTGLSFFKKEMLREFVGINGCPMAERVYMVTGMPVTNMENVLVNIPKTFFYGTYKIRIQFTDKKYTDDLGCLTAVVDIKRPWET